MDTFIQVTKIFTFDTAHALLNHDGLCKNIHGHTYRLSVTIGGVPLCDPSSPKDGMVIDFSDLKAIVNDSFLKEWDHSLILNECSPLTRELTENFEKVVIFPAQPTCENMLIEIKNRLHSRFDSRRHSLVALKLEETPTSYAEWKRGIHA